jgi:hypothetical protein
VWREEADQKGYFEVQVQSLLFLEDFWLKSGVAGDYLHLRAGAITGSSLFRCFPAPVLEGDFEEFGLRSNKSSSKRQIQFVAPASQVDP